MKKTRWVAAGIVAASIGLAGCQDGQTDSGSGSGSTKSGELSNTELLKKATAAQEDIKSFHMDGTVSSKAGEMAMDQKVSADIIQKPLAMKQTMTMKNPEDGKDVTIESYIVDDKMYLSQNGQWIVQDVSELGEMVEAMESSASTEQNLQLLKKYKDNWTAKKEGDVYQIDVKLSGDDLKSFMKDSLEQTGQMAQMKDAMDSIDYKKMNYKMTYDAKTFYPKSLDMDMVFAIEKDTEFNMKNESTFSKFNEIDEIKLPAEAKDAQPLTGAGQ
ncbi:LppX_LprAFG lipoprotein [Exiguobacterium acetylicum]|uniref:DUF6612 family protein n=1 Tax=Exiguobacterium acetylicum TaxID=41170 RepID=UPI0039776D81